MQIRGLFLEVCLGFVCLTGAYAQQYTINTVAGNGTAGYTGDSGAPLAAQLNSPNAIAFDSKGNLYIADSQNHRVRMVSGGTITTIAGNGTAGYLGDVAAATAAELNNPSGLAFDSAGNLYISDTNNHVIRKITGTTISTFAGTQGLGPGYGGDGGLANVSTLNFPTGLLFDSAGDLFIADNGNNLIRRIDASTSIITSYLGAGATQGKLDHPNAMALDASGAMYIADSNHNRIGKWAAPNFINLVGTEVAGFSGDGGPAAFAQLNHPAGLALDASGSLYIADSNNSRIRKVAPDGTISTIAGRGGASYSGDGGSATLAFLSNPRTLLMKSDGTIYIADTGNAVIRVLAPTYPVINSGGVGNAASYATKLSPGMLAAVFGTGFGTATLQSGATGNWPTTLGGVGVTVNGIAAPVYYVSPGQINFQVPWASPVSGTVGVAVTLNGGSSSSVNVPVATAAPGLFVLASKQAAVENSDFSVNDPSNPAKVGSTIFAFLTGSGPVAPAAASGVPASTTTLVYATASVSATIGGLPATVSFAGLAPGFIGLVQLNIIVPTSLSAGSYPLIVTIDGQASNAAPITLK
jgi:uncharacterized protein (TIGR03437 family)